MRTYTQVSARRTASLAVCALLLASLSGCAARSPDTYDFRIEGFESNTPEQSSPLGGEALQQRKHELRRAQGDLHHFYTTLLSLEERKERSGQVLFAAFIDAYMGLHLDPLLRSEWQSRHPELSALDANLRIAKAELFSELHDPGRVDDVIDELLKRYQGRQTMLVEYPFGEQTTLGEAVERLAGTKWRI